MNKIEGLGNKIEHEDRLIGRKDAFHVSAVLCEVGDHPLTPGQPVMFTGDAYSSVRPALVGETAHGIVDPFIDGILRDDGMILFWVIIRPGYTTGVRHDFDINLPVTGADFQKCQWDCRDC